ncbi:MAG: Ig-like domain-containing protein, partial [Anaerolineae bacterium]
WARSAGWPLPPTEYDFVGTGDPNRAGRITAPLGLGLVRGVLDVRGTLDPDKVVAFNLEYGAGINPTAWANIGGGDLTGRGEDVLLGRWDTTSLDGLYTLRLSLTLNDGRFEPSILQITVDNVPPVAQFSAPEQNASYAVSDAVVHLSANVTDNFEVAYAEIFHNGEFLTKIENAPFNADWVIDAPGVHTFVIVAYDRAGNSGASQTLTVNVRE